MLSTVGDTVSLVYNGICALFGNVSTVDDVRTVYSNESTVFGNVNTVKLDLG